MPGEEEKLAKEFEKTSCKIVKPILVAAEEMLKLFERDSVQLWV